MPLNPSLTPLSSKNRLYIQCSLVTGFKTSIILFCMLFCLILRSIVSNMFSSISSSASSSTQHDMPCNDLREAVWFPDDVFIPLNSISLFVDVLTTSDLFMLNIESNPNRPIFSKNSGIIDK